MPELWPHCAMHSATVCQLRRKPICAEFLAKKRASNTARGPGAWLTLNHCLHTLKSSHPGSRLRWLVANDRVFRRVSHRPRFETIGASTMTTPYSKVSGRIGPVLDGRSLRSLCQHRCIQSCRERGAGRGWGTGVTGGGGRVSQLTPRASMRPSAAASHMRILLASVCLGFELAGGSTSISEWDWRTRHSPVKHGAVRAQQ